MSFEVLDGREARIAELRAILPVGIATTLADLEAGHPDLKPVNVRVHRGGGGAHAQERRWQIVYKPRVEVTDDAWWAYVTIHEYAHLTAGCQWGHTERFWNECFSLVEKYRPNLLSLAKEKALNYRPRGARAAIKRKGI